MRTIVQFDGSNFYNKVKRSFPHTHLTHFNYSGLAYFVSKHRSSKIIYYVGEIRQYDNSPKSMKLYANQQKLFTHIRNDKIIIKLGYLLMSKGKFHEKGVDVQIAVDMVRGAIKNEYDVCYLISSDTDLIPAIQTAKDERKKIIYIGFEHSFSRALMKNCSSYLILKREDLLPFVKKK